MIFFKKTMIQLRGEKLKKKLKVITSWLCVFSILTACCFLLKVSDGYAVYTLAENNRDLPIYCVDRDDGKLSISFDCAWGTE